MPPASPRERGLVMFVCSSGGHLAQLYALRDWWKDRRRTWVTFDTVDAVSRLQDEQVVWAHHPTTRNIPNLLRNLLLAWRTLRRMRPSVVVSDGAGVAVPFFVISRLLGIPTVYLEVYDRMESSTMSGRLCHPFTDLFLVQWPEQERLYPRAIVAGRVL